MRCRSANLLQAWARRMRRKLVWAPKTLAIGKAYVRASIWEERNITV